MDTKELKTKSQMIMRIAELSEENTLLREQLYNKSETEQALQVALEEKSLLKENIKKLEDRLQLRIASDKESDAFWDEIFSEKDYPFNKENAYKELKDYYFVLEQLPKIYMEITGGTLSKTTYFASSVVEAYNDALNKYYQKIDNLEYENNEYKSALDEIKDYIIDELEGYYLSKKDDYATILEKIERIVDKVLYPEDEVLWE